MLARGELACWYDAVVGMEEVLLRAERQHCTAVPDNGILGGIVVGWLVSSVNRKMGESWNVGSRFSCVIGVPYTSQLNIT